MSSVIKFEALSGCQNESVPCYVLDIDGFNIMLDCGFDVNCTEQYLNQLKEIAYKIDAVLLTYPDIYHLGAIPYLVCKCPLSCSVYCTVPVYKMGQMFHYEYYQSVINEEEFKLYNLDDVDVAFGRIKKIKYNQTVLLNDNITVIPLPSGHMIGGTAWKIIKDGEEEMIYAVDYNHKIEKHLSSGNFRDYLQRPLLLITDAFNANYVHPKRKVRDELLTSTILQTLTNQGNVLICADTAGRVLEIILLLEQLWKTLTDPSSNNLVFLSHVGNSVIKFAKSQIEWMSDKIQKSFEEYRQNPFDLNFCKVCHSLTAIDAIKQPMVVVTGMGDLEYGFGRTLFIRWAVDERNCIITTSRSNPYTLGRKLFDKSTDLKNLPISVRSKSRKVVKDVKSAELKTSKKSILVKEEVNEMEFEEDLKEQVKQDIFITRENFGRNGYFVYNRKCFPTFPYKQISKIIDEYGEIIDHSLFQEKQRSAKAEPETEEFETEERSEPCDLSTVEEYNSELKNVEVCAKLVFIDFEGKSDGDSVRKVLQQIKPKNLILVHGSAESTNSLRKHCSVNSIVSGKIFTPSLFENIDVISHSSVLQVVMKDSLLNSLRFVGTPVGCDISWLDSVVESSEYSHSEAKRKAVPLLSQINNLTHSAVFFNNPKFTEIKNELEKHKISCEFVSGSSLLCENIILLRKNDSKVSLEGPLCSLYYSVRDVLYSFYSII